MSENEKQLLNVIDQTSFAMDDAALFLDTHPCDQMALAYYQSVVRMRGDAMNAYQSGYGPLTAESVSPAGGYWMWAQGPWPWEGGR